MIQESIQHLVGAGHVGLQEPGLEVLVGSLRGVDSCGGPVNHSPDGDSRLRGDPSQDMIKLGGGPGDVLDAELRLRLLEPSQRMSTQNRGSFMATALTEASGSESAMVTGTGHRTLVRTLP